MRNKESIYSPTLSEVILLPIFSFLFFAIANMPVTYRRFLSPEEYAISSSYLTRFTSYLNNDVINNIGLFVFWSLVGLLSYSILSCILFIVHAYRSEIPFQHYSVFHPDARTKLDAFIRMLLRSTALAMLVVWLLTNLFSALRYMNGIFVDGIVYVRIQNFLLVSVLAAFDIFVGLFLMRLFLLRRHIPGE